MKKLLCLMLTLLLCTACTALPAEERAFAVVLCVEKAGDSWRVLGRVPTYQSGGGYLTVTGEGASFDAALAAMDAAAPMHIHLSQLRLLVLAAALGDEVPAVLLELSDRPDVRPDCAVCLTEESADAVMAALKPETGARLSKTLDVLLETRTEQGQILPARLCDAVRMGERQSPVLINLTLETGKIDLTGGWPLSEGMRPALRLTARETVLLAMLRGEAKSLVVSLPQGSARVRDASAKVRLEGDMQSARVELTLRATASDLTGVGLEQALAEELLTLLGRLSGAGCDALGLGRQAILSARDMARWHALAWPDRYRALRWTVSVGVKERA